MRGLLAIHALLAVCGAILVSLVVEPLSGISFATGAMVSFANLVVLVFVWPRIFAKKLVALSVGVIIFKFAILVWILNEVATGKQLQLGWFSTGLGLVILSAIATAIRESRSTEDEVS